MPPRSSRAASRRYPRPNAPRRPSCSWFWFLVALFVLVVAALILRQPRSEPRLIGIVAGHWQYDSGATCQDGLREVDITLPVAQRVVRLLQDQGYQAEVLGEYSDRLRGLRATAVVSLHADSCLPDFSGYKIAGQSSGPAAGPSALLVECLSRAYAAASGLRFHENTVTPAMTHYHAFYEVDPQTPIAIVELGFMGGDRTLLTAQQERVALGIAQGIVAFLNAISEPPATPTTLR